MSDLSENGYIGCLDTCLWAYERIISWDYSKCLKKLVENLIHSSQVQ